MKKAIIVGLGTMGSHHLRVLATTPGVEVCAVVDLLEERREAALAAHSTSAAYPTLEEALAKESPDFVCLAAPVAQLPRLCAECAAAGVSMLVEKPMAPSEDEARGMIAAAEAAGVMLSVGYVERFNPAVLALGEKLAGGVIGKPLQVHSRRLSPFPDRDQMQGVALDLATHDIDVMRFVVGAEVARVYAETAQPYGTGSEDLVCATLRFDSDVTGLVEANWITPAKVREITITGEKGMFVVDYVGQELRFFENPSADVEWPALAGIRGPAEGDMVRYALRHQEPLRSEWEAFLAALEADGPAPVTGRDGLAALSVGRAIQRSASESAAVAPGYRALEAA